MGKTIRDAGQRARFRLLLGAAIATSLGGAPAQGLAAPLTQPVKMHIRLYDYAHVPSKVLVKAEGQTGIIFRQAGVEVTWENSVPPKDPSQAKPTSPRPPDAASVDLRIVTHFESISGALRHHSMGFAVPPDTASISLEWVEKLASLGVAEEYQVLGAAMTHEIGHLFLGPNSHSSVGIMRAGWKEDDLKQASQARLTFTTSEAERIRTEVRQSQEQQPTASGSARPTTVLTPSSESMELSLAIKVRVHNYARVPAEILRWAEDDVSKIFLLAGVGTTFADCPLTREQVVSYPACRDPAGPSDFILNIVTPGMAKRLPFSSDGFGFAAPCGSGQASCTGYVFYERARQLAPSANVDLSVVLSRVLAHELRHLLGLVHSEIGLMRAEWNPSDFGPNSLVGMVFTPWECQRIHAEAAARASPKTPS